MIKIKIVSVITLIAIILAIVFLCVAIDWRLVLCMTSIVVVYVGITIVFSSLLTAKREGE